MSRVRWNTELVAAEMAKENCFLISEYKSANTKLKYNYNGNEYFIAWKHWVDKKHPTRPHLHGGNLNRKRPDVLIKWNNEKVNELFQKEDCELVSNYVNTDTKLKYKYHNSFYWVSLHNWIGCHSRPHLHKNRLEKQFRDYLETNNIEFETQKTYPDLRSKNKVLLRFDFYLPTYQLLVEMDEKTHLYKANRERDILKDEYCKEHKIKLLRIDETVSKDDYEKAINNIKESDIYLLRYGEIYVKMDGV